MAELIWREPPKGKRPYRMYMNEAQQLRDNPGKPAVIKSFPVHSGSQPRDLVAAINLGKYTAFRPAGAFEAESHTEGDVVNVYAKYTGN